jgi:hypothetical protein
MAIQDWHIFLRMAVADPDHFQYKVVFGSQENVAAEIRCPIE